MIVILRNEKLFIKIKENNNFDLDQYRLNGNANPPRKVPKGNKTIAVNERKPEVATPVDILDPLNFKSVQEEQKYYASKKKEVVAEKGGSLTYRQKAIATCTLSIGFAIVEAAKYRC